MLTWKSLDGFGYGYQRTGAILMLLPLICCFLLYSPSLFIIPWTFALEGGNLVTKPPRIQRGLVSIVLRMKSNAAYSKKLGVRLCTDLHVIVEGFNFIGACISLLLFLVLLYVIVEVTYFLLLLCVTTLTSNFCLKVNTAAFFSCIRRKSCFI